MKEKRTSIFMLLMLTSTLLAQVPPGITHQAVIRNATNELVINSPIGIRVSILEDDIETAVYTETHTITSNANGLITLVIGQGSVVNGIFEEIEWASGPFFLKTEVDPDGGAAYSISGISQLHSVPYALYAQTSADAFEGDMGGDPIILLADPTEEQQAATKASVDLWEPRVIEMENSELQIYTLNIVVDTPEGGTVSGAGQYAAGEQITINASVNPGWQLVNYTDENNFIVSYIHYFYYTMPSHNVTFNANFLEFVCGSSTIYDFDGNAYNTVQIGSQCWMKENLKTTHRRGGQPIPYETGYKWYDNDIAWKDIYGALYWNPSGADGLGGAVCPSGWVVPTLDKFDDLFVYIGGIESHNANKLKSCRQVNSPLGGDCNTSEHPRWEEEANYYGTDDYGFSALPGGYGDEDGGTYAMGGNGWWWSRTARLNGGWSKQPYFIVILDGFGEVHINWSSEKFLSIRCVQM